MTRPIAHPTRRTVVRGAAWSVPVVAVAAAAPAFAVSPCDTPITGTVNFAATGNYTRTNEGLGKANVVMSDGSVFGVTFTSVMTAGYIRATNNLQAGTSSPFPGSLGMLQTRTDGDTSTARGQVVTITFDRPVFNLVLPLSSFSWPTSTTSYQDAAWVSPAPAAANIANGANVTGAGTTGNPFRNPVTGDSPAVPYSGPTTTTTLTYPGGTAGLSSVVVHYFDRLSGTGHTNQGMSILNMSFAAKPAGCA